MLVQVAFQEAAAAPKLACWWSSISSNPADEMLHEQLTGWVLGSRAMTYHRDNLFFTLQFTDNILRMANIVYLGTTRF